MGGCFVLSLCISLRVHCATRRCGRPHTGQAVLHLATAVLGSRCANNHIWCFWDENGSSECKEGVTMVLGVAKKFSGLCKEVNFELEIRSPIWFDLRQAQREFA